jgi:protein-disulfide isomerase
MELKPIVMLTAVLAFTAAVTLELQRADAASNESVLTSEAVLHDPRIPADGNPNGDLTIVEYFDYRCLSCKQVNSVLQNIALQDEHVRLVFKDWPVFGGVSIYMARVALAAKFQNKFLEAHNALISLRGTPSETNVLASLAEAGIDMSRLQRDLSIHQKEIDAILANNQQQAAAFGFEGTPSFIIEQFRVPAVFNTRDFKKFIAEARASHEERLYGSEAD